MNNLPFIYPDDQLELNIGIMILIIQQIGKSKRGRSIIGNDNAATFLNLIKKPVLLNLVLRELNLEGVELSHSENYSLNALSSNTIGLFDRNETKSLIKYMLMLNLISVEFIDKKGFFYSITDEGNKLANTLESNYFKSVKKYLNKVQSLTSITPNKLNFIISNILRRN